MQELLAYYSCSQVNFGRLPIFLISADQRTKITVKERSRINCLKKYVYKCPNWTVSVMADLKFFDQNLSRIFEMDLYTHYIFLCRPQRGSCQRGGGHSVCGHQQGKLCSCSRDVCAPCMNAPSTVLQDRDGSFFETFSLNRLNNLVLSCCLDLSMQ